MLVYESLEVFTAVEDETSVVGEEVEGRSLLRATRTDDLQVATNEGGVIYRLLFHLLCGRHDFCGWSDSVCSVRRSSLAVYKARRC